MLFSKHRAPGFPSRKVIGAIRSKFREADRPYSYMVSAEWDKLFFPSQISPDAVVFLLRVIRVFLTIVRDSERGWRTFFKLSDYTRIVQTSSSSKVRETCGL